MNKVYKVIWSKAKNCYVVASELAKSHTKAPKSGVMSRALVAGVLACVLSCGAVMPVYATDGVDETYDGPAFASHIINQTVTITGDNGSMTGLIYFENPNNNNFTLYHFYDDSINYGPNTFLVYDDTNGSSSPISNNLKNTMNQVFGCNTTITYQNGTLRVTPASGATCTKIIDNSYANVNCGDVMTLNVLSGTPVLEFKRYQDARGRYFWNLEQCSGVPNLHLQAWSSFPYDDFYIGVPNISSLTLSNGVLNATTTVSATTINASNSSITAKNIKTTSGDIDASTSNLTATNTIESAGAIKAGSLNAGNVKAAAASTIGGALTVSGKISGVSNGTANTDAVNYSQLKPAIKALSVSGKTITYTKIDGTTGTITTQDTDTHYTTHLYAGSGTAANANTTNGNTKLTLADNSTVRESITIKGTGATTVTSSGGVITINSTDNNTTYSAMKGATASAAGTAGLVPAPAAGKQTAFLRGDGTWVVPTDTNTHYTTHLYAGTGAAANAATSNGSTKIALTDDSTVRNTLTIKGTGATTVTSDANGVITINSTDNNTTYSAATQSANGLMSAADKAKLDGIASGANAYTLPAATSSALGGVKIGSNITNSDGTISLTKANVTAALGYTPPTTDTNTTYDNMSATELSTGTATTARSISAKVLVDYVTGKVSAETTARTTAINTEANARANADTALGTRIDNTVSAYQTADTDLSNRIGSLSADGNYIKKSATNNVSANLTALDTQLKTTATAVGTETTNRTNADTALSNRIGSVASDGTFIKKSATNDVATNLTALDTAAKNAIKGLSVSGTTITYTKGDGTTGTITTQDTTYTAGNGLSLTNGSFSVNTNGAVVSGNTGIVTGGTVYDALEARIGQINVENNAQNTVAVGDGSSVGGDGAVAVGTGSSGSGEGSVAVGGNTSADGTGSVAVGDTSSSTGEGSVAIGGGTSTSSDNSVVVGTGSTVTGTDSENSVAIGGQTNVTGSDSVALGGGSSVNGSESTALGGNTVVNNNNSVALGYGSNASQDNVVSVGHTANDTDADGTAYGADLNRRIVNVAAGTSGTDAATVSQTYVLQNGTNTTVSDAGTNAIGQHIYQMTVNTDGQVASGNTGIVTGGTVYDALESRIGQITVQNDAQNTVALGDNSSVSGDGAVAVGSGSSGSGEGSVAIGDTSNSSGEGSVAVFIDFVIL